MKRSDLSPSDRRLHPRVFKDRLEDLICGLTFLSGIPLPKYAGGGAYGHWGNKYKDPWSALRRAGRVFRK